MHAAQGIKNIGSALRDNTTYIIAKSHITATRTLQPCAVWSAARFAPTIAAVHTFSLPSALLVAARSGLPLLSSRTFVRHAAVVTNAPRIREILTLDSGLERLIRIRPWDDGYRDALLRFAAACYLRRVTRAKPRGSGESESSEAFQHGTLPT